MKYCREWQETLWLDVHGELSPQVRLEWEKHLEGCRPCHQERIQLLHLLKNVNEAVPEPSLSHEDAGALYNAISGQLKEEHRGRARRRKSFFEGYMKPVHALAACCLLIVVLGWFGLKGLQQNTRIGTISDSGSKEQLIAMDMDLLENLELLEEMDTLEKLDRVMGKGETKI
jgi:Putative zinc-finger